MNNYFEFINTGKILCGDNSLSNIQYELDFFGCKNPMLLSDEGIDKAGVLTIFKNACKGVNFNTLYTKVPTDSSTLTVNQIARLYRHNKCDGLVALGGGSVIDTAKCVRLLLSQGCQNILTLSGNEIIKKGKLIPFIVVPTTSGTGSECTAVAVIKDPKTKTKVEFISSEMLPNVAVLDVRLTKSLPSKLIASTAVDALAHAVESYTGVQKNAISDSFAITAISLIANNLLDAINDNDNYSKLNLALASNLAGMAFSNSMVGIVHAIAHAVGAVCNIPHGNAVAMLLVPCMRFNLEMCHVEYGKLLLHFTSEDVYISTNPTERGKAFIDKVEELLHTLNERAGLSLKLSDYKVKENKFDEIAQKAIDDGASITNQKRFTKEDVIEILKEIL